MSRSKRVGTAPVTRAGMRLLAAHPTPTVWQVFVATVQYMDRDLQMAPGHRQVADDTGKALRTVRLAYAYLVGAGVFTVIARGNQHRAARYGIGPTLQACLDGKGRQPAAATCSAGANGRAAAFQSAGAKH